MEPYDPRQLFPAGSHTPRCGGRTWTSKIELAARRLRLPWSASARVNNSISRRSCSTSQCSAWAGIEQGSSQRSDCSADGGTVTGDVKVDLDEVTRAELPVGRAGCTDWQVGWRRAIQERLHRREERRGLRRRRLVNILRRQLAQPPFVDRIRGTIGDIAI